MSKVTELLKSLEGNSTNEAKSLLPPKEIKGSFDCRKMLLTSLEGAPEKVGGVFMCSINKLKSLE